MSNLTQIIQQKFNQFKNEVQKRAPHAEVNLYSANKLQIVGGNAFEVPVADVRVELDNKDYKYCLLYNNFSGTFRTIPIVIK